MRLPRPDPADVAACSALLKQHARSFHAASRLLPASVRESASVLYAFCRVADDTVDEHGGRHLAIAKLRARLDAAYDGKPTSNAVDRALGAVVARHAIPRLLPEQLLEGLTWDAEGRTYDSLDELLDYAARVAGSVGAMMALLMGARSSAALARACDLGVAMQLSNIARDVAEDAGRGRLYLPREWLREAGIDGDAWLAAPAWSPALEGVLRRLLAAADGLYARAASGISALPLGCRPGINAARLLYAAIGHEVLRVGASGWPRRAVVSPGRRAWLLARAAVTPWPLAAGRHEPPLHANRILVAAVRDACRRSDADFVLELFLRLSQRERVQTTVMARRAS
ncbi:phytoene/squalene synthase family protein [Ideonella sp. DXS29W]|uniref:Phytoene/squalene synthase family protein n=1 Tax=Ideonella lacteola TaxID=2984193 RepID=A0ABU9BNC3_9BURK